MNHEYVLSIYIYTHTHIHTHGRYVRRGTYTAGVRRACMLLCSHMESFLSRAHVKPETLRRAFSLSMEA